jgi:hypothetical protein
VSVALIHAHNAIEWYFQLFFIADDRSSMLLSLLVSKSKATSAAREVRESLPLLTSRTSGRVNLCKLVSTAPRYRATVTANWPKEVLNKRGKPTNSGPSEGKVNDVSNVQAKDAVSGMLDAWAFAYADPYRACTHNKGILNGASKLC